MSGYAWHWRLAAAASGFWPVRSAYTCTVERWIGGSRVPATTANHEARLLGVTASWLFPALDASPAERPKPRAPTACRPGTSAAAPHPIHRHRGR
jgi:hypothetical protein